jgi:uncharacterized phage-associated protein
MVNVHDVAAYILKKQGKMSTMKLQKLLYYCQAWSLVWDEQPMFRAKIEAWANGPVVRTVYNCYKGSFAVSTPKLGDSSTLNPKQRETVDAVLEAYGTKTAQWLIQLTHREKPWLDARIGLAPGEAGYQEITLESMAEYYSGLIK